MHYIMMIFLTFLISVNLVACGESDGMGTLSFKATRIEVDDKVDSVTFSIARISVSETGENWSLVAENIPDLTIDSDSILDLEQKEMPAGEYHGVKIELASGISYNLAEGGTVQKDHPDILLYQVLMPT